MKKLLDKKLFVLIFVSLITVGMLWLTKLSKSEPSFSSEIAKLIKTPHIESIDLSALAPFPWEKCFIFHPYTSPKQIHDALGFTWRDVGSTSIESNDRVSLLVFVENNQVVKWLEHPRGQGDFSPVKWEEKVQGPGTFVFPESGLVVERANARFSVERRNEWVDLKYLK